MKILNCINLNNNKATGSIRSIMTFIIITFLLSSNACKKFVDIPAPIDQITAGEVFNSEATATSATVGLYSQMMASNLFFANGAMSVYPALSADEVYNTTTSTTLDPFTSNALSSSNTIITTNIWRYGYNYIYQANACIEGLANSTALSAATKNQLTGEMLVTRALCYFYLTNIFGDVPLETTTDYKINEITPRTPVATIYNQIVTDLKQAEFLLNTTYPSTGKVRPNKYAAAALLSRVYLYQKDYVNAEAQATLVINSGIYSLVTDLNNVFLANSAEAIWQLVPVSTSFNSAEGATFVPSSTTVKPAYAINNYLLNAFEAGDKRKSTWLKSNTVSSITYFYPYKYKVRSSTTKTEYSNVLRLAEVFLIRAEARAQNNDFSGAVSDVNVIRSRSRDVVTTAIPNPLPALSTSLAKTDILTAIANENRIELFAEWGHRWFDLNRRGQSDLVLGSEKSGWQSTDALYPIPFAELQKNIYLTQNQGY